VHLDPSRILGQTRLLEGRHTSGAMGASPYVRCAIYGGIAAAVVAIAIISGIILNVLNDGENHKESMLKSPPPPSSPTRMRAMQEFEETYRTGNAHFDLTKDEKGVFETLAHRKMASSKRFR